MENYKGYEGEIAIPYDLRQIYAVNLVGEHLQDVARARKADNYKAYFKCLRDLWIIVQHKIKDNKSKKKYEELLNKAIEKMNKHPNIFISSTKNSNGVWEVETALNNIEMFLYDEMEKAALFGSKRDMEGLV